MHIKKMLAIGLSTVILLTLIPFALPTASAVPAQAYWVEPQDSGSVSIFGTFVVDVMTNFTDPDPLNSPPDTLYGIEYKFKWSNDYLAVVKIDTHADAVADAPVGWDSPFVATNTTSDLGDGRDQHHYATATLGGTGSVGVYSFCTYTFQVIKEPLWPAPDYVGLLDLQDTKLTDDSATLVPHTTTDGSYTVPATAGPLPPIVSLQPAPIIQGELGVFFNVSVVIEELHPLYDLCGWEAKVSFNNTVLEGMNSFEGPFLPGFAGPNGTFYLNLINNTLGLVHTSGLFLGPHTAPTGTGVVAYLMFNATRDFEVPTEGAPPFDYPMDLFDVKLTDCNITSIDIREVRDTIYRAPYYSLGWALDCWTDPYRVFCETDKLGLGPNATADAYSPQQFVKLYAYLQYNEYPEQNKDVWFVVSGPINPYDNVTFVRSAITNASGVATINFTIPWPCEHAYEMIMGKWTCYQYAWVKNPWKPGYYEKVFDILQWDVGWIVELIDVTVDPDPVMPCQDLAITITYKNIMQIPKDVIFTFTILDTLLDPIADMVMEKRVLEGEYCNPYYDNLTVTIHIPKWTHVGPGATVYVNAFSALPSECGLIFCPEISVSFTIAKP